jgi:hypothetical protein
MLFDQAQQPACLEAFRYTKSAMGTRVAVPSSRCFQRAEPAGQAIGSGTQPSFLELSMRKLTQRLTGIGAACLVVFGGIAFAQTDSSQGKGTTGSDTQAGALQRPAQPADQTSTTTSTPSSTTTTTTTDTSSSSMNTPSSTTSSTTTTSPSSSSYSTTTPSTSTTTSPSSSSYSGSSATSSSADTTAPAPRSDRG